MLTYAVINVLYYAANVPLNGWPITLLATMEYIPAFTLVPRFILSLRELYACDLQGKRGNDIDTAFGFTSAFGHGTSTATTTIVFADTGRNEGSEQGEEIAMEIRGAGHHWVMETTV